MLDCLYSSKPGDKSKLKVTMSHSKQKESGALISLASDYMLNCLYSSKHGDETKLQSYNESMHENQKNQKR